MDGVQAAESRSSPQPHVTGTSQPGTIPPEPRFWAAAAQGTELTNHNRDAGHSQFTLQIRALLP